jgi:Aspartate/ornithine carbamoyltransferase, Asp/Orn binding domain
MSGVEWEESSDLLEVASLCDVVYQTRIQKERFGERIDLYEAARGKYIVDKKVLDVMQKHAVVMHPLPRLDEVIHLLILSFPYPKCAVCFQGFFCMLHNEMCFDIGEGTQYLFIILCYSK